MNYYSFFPILSQFLLTIDTPQPESFPPSEEIQKYKELMEILTPYHNPKNDKLITIADIVKTLEKA